MTAGNSPHGQIPDVAEVRHLGFLMEGARRHTQSEIQRTASEFGLLNDYPGLRGSHARLLSILPAAGARITDMVEAAGMTKQALGQFFDTLEEGGYVATRRDPSDRRVRIIERTAKGDGVVRLSNEMWKSVEDELAEQVGPRRWRTFRAVLDELTVERP